MDASDADAVKAAAIGERGGRGKQANECDDERNPGEPSNG